MEKLKQTEMMTNVNMKIKLTPCGNCGEECSQYCGNCRKESYCSVICQKLRRRLHKLICFPANVEIIGDGTHGNDPTGIYWAATRDIEVGERIFKDYPLMIGPGDQESHTGCQICLGCHVILSNFNIEKDKRKCLDCKWPMCGPRCPRILHHQTTECRTLKKMRQVMTFQSAANLDKDGIASVYQSVRIIRLLLLSLQDPIKWRNIQNLFVPDYAYQSISNAPKLDGLMRFYNKILGFHHLTKEEIIHAIVVEIYHRRNSDDKFKNRCELYYYDKETRLDISCVENCLLWKIMTIDKKKAEAFAVGVMATKRISKGERLTISPCKEHKWNGTKLRRRNLQNVLGFTCECTRCVDPTELGSYISAVICPSCRSGYVLPQNPLDEDSIWICNSRTCATILNSKIVNGLLAEIQSAADAVMSGIDTTKFDGFNDMESRPKQDPTRLASLEKFVADSEKFLSPNHYILLNIEKVLMTQYMYMIYSPVQGTPVTGNNDPQWLRMDVIEIGRLRNLAKKFIYLGNKIFPQLSAPLINAYYFLAMSNFYFAEERTRSGGYFYEILEWLTEGSAIRTFVEFNVKKLLPVRKLDYLEASMKYAQNVVVGLCLQSHIYRPMMEKLLEVYNQNRTTVPPTLH